jgi:predicted nucleic acid-binding protein
VKLVADSSALALLINPESTPPNDPSTGLAVVKAHERIQGFINGLSATDTLIVPTPVLAELLVKAENDAPQLLEQLQGQARLRVRPFDERAAVELAMMTREALSVGDKRGGSQQPWQKVKFDRQIVAIARVAEATHIYADDVDLANFARSLGIEAVSTWDLAIPEETKNLFTEAGLQPDGTGI